MTGNENLQACKNCNHNFTGKYCNQCGQKVIQRITVPQVIHDFIHVFLHADKGVFPFMSRLMVQPGTMAKEYIGGRRKMFNPYQYLIFSVGFLIFLMTQSDFYNSLEMYSSQRSGHLPTHFQKGMADFNLFTQKYTNVITFLSMPIIAVFSWLFFKKRLHNYAEHFTLIVFAMAMSCTLNALVFIGIILFKVPHLSTVYISLLLTIFCMALSYFQFYSLRWYTALWKGILVYTVAYIGQLIIMMIFLFGYIFYLKYMHD